MYTTRRYTQEIVCTWTFSVVCSLPIFNCFGGGGVCCIFMFRESESIPGCSYGGILDVCRVVTVIMGLSYRCSCPLLPPGERQAEYIYVRNKRHMMHGCRCVWCQFVYM